MKILINTLGIQDSGGITVLKKVLREIKDTKYKCLIICNKNQNIEKIITEFIDSDNLEFLMIKTKGFLYRIYYENIIFRKIIKERKIKFVYNFSGTAQFFFKIPQMTKVHNLLFYSKKIEKVYFEKKEYLNWFRQIFLKRIIFQSMLKQTEYVEVQSSHVKEYINDFIDLKKKHFFIKSDINVSDDLFLKPKNYDFTSKINFLYIVGPHFEYLHKNFEEFVKAMKVLKNENFHFEIIMTLSKEQLHTSDLWDKQLDENTNFLGYISKDQLKEQFEDNPILISTSVIETLGLHVVEAIQNGNLTIVPNEIYANSVYGEDVLKYNLFDVSSLVNIIKNVLLQDDNIIKDIISKNQTYIIDNEKQKYLSIIKIFDEILKDKNV